MEKLLYLEAERLQMQAGMDVLREVSVDALYYGSTQEPSKDADLDRYI